MFTSLELQILRSSLDVINIKGSDAKVISQLQVKLEDLLKEAEPKSKK
jgi:hypothetical protein